MKIRKLGADGYIGGSCIEISSSKAKIILDVGSQLDEDREEILVPGLYEGEKDYDAVFISHYHLDHLGRANEVLKGIPIYMDESSFRIAKEIGSFLDEELRFSPKFYKEGKTIKIKDIDITPIWCEHSAFSSFMFLIEIEDKKILYTGDFRGNGISSYGNFLSRLPKVDVLICESTTLNGEHDLISERELIEKVKESSKDFNHVFYLSSSSHLTRNISFYKGKGKRKFILDPLTSSLLDEVDLLMDDASIYNPYFYNPIWNKKAISLMKEHHLNCLPIDKIMHSRFMMSIKESSYHYLFDSLLSRGFDFSKTILIYSLWKGYIKKDEGLSRFLSKYQSLGGKIAYIHSSGHAGELELEKLINSISPQIIIPVHGENYRWFLKFFNKQVICEENEFIL